MAKEMRKKSRQTSEACARQVLREAPYVTVSFTLADGTPYGLPLSLAGEGDVLYFHCAHEGQKLDAIRANAMVSLSAVTMCQPAMNPKTGGFTLEYESAVAFGRAEIVTCEREKRRALQLICERFLPADMDKFEAAVARSLAQTAVVRITLVEPPVGKRRILA